MRSEDTEPPEPSPMDDFLVELDGRPPKFDDEPQAPPELLTVAETAHWLRCSPDSVRRWIRRGYLRSYRKGPHPTARYLVAREDAGTERASSGP
jgi:excisionase family DNA binding protein